MTKPDLETFSDRVYYIVSQVPFGHVVTYGQVAVMAGHAGAARAVGNLMKNSISAGLEIPWQRVINAQARISFRGDMHRADAQLALLRQEGVEFNQALKIDMDTFQWLPDDVFWEADDHS